MAERISRLTDELIDSCSKPVHKSKGLFAKIFLVLFKGMIHFLRL